MAPLQQIGRNGGPNACFADFQRVVECMTSSAHSSFQPCEIYKNDYIECRKHILERYKMFILHNKMKESGNEDIGAPYVKQRKFLTPKTLGIPEGDDTAINVSKL